MCPCTYLENGTQEGEYFFHEEGILSISGCMFVIYELKNNKAFKEQVDKCLSNQFDVTTSKHIMKTPKQYHTRVIDLIIFYNDSKSLIFNELGVFVHFFIEKYVHVDYLSF